ncbi:MAG: hypothetical protein HY011_32160 [Acidobacteria bacterium]|nr:hypothetical protein [Acidobacteriota bacterium]
MRNAEGGIGGLQRNEFRLRNQKNKGWEVRYALSGLLALCADVEKKFRIPYSAFRIQIAWHLPPACIHCEYGS